MPKLLFFYLARRIVIATLVVQVALTVPVVLTALFHQLPPAAMRGGLVWPALMGTLLKVENVSAAYRLGNGAELRAVDEVSLELRGGEVLGVVGESGSGKSTLATVLALIVLWLIRVLLEPVADRMGKPGPRAGDGD